MLYGKTIGAELVIRAVSKPRERAYGVVLELGYKGPRIAGHLIVGLLQ